MPPAAALSALADRLVQLHARRDPDRGQVAIAGAGVAVTTSMPRADAKRDRDVIRVAMAHVISSTLPLEAEQVARLVNRLVFLEDANGRASISVCGSELVGLEDIKTATDRALAMRAFLTAELERALSDEPPETRRSVPPISAEAR